MAGGHIPVEYHGDSTTLGIPVSGAGKLEFPADPRFGGRRLEWLHSDAQVQKILAFNRPGRPPLFEVASDILAGQADADLTQTVRKLTDERFDSVEERMEALAALTDQVNELVRRLGEVEGQSRAQQSQVEALRRENEGLGEALAMQSERLMNLEKQVPTPKPKPRKAKGKAAEGADPEAKVED